MDLDGGPRSETRAARHLRSPAGMAIGESAANLFLISIPAPAAIVAAAIYWWPRSQKQEP
jgi:hypothetical protein